MIDGAGEDDEEHQQEGAAGEDEGSESENRSYNTVSECLRKLVGVDARAAMMVTVVC